MRAQLTIELAGFSAMILRELTVTTVTIARASEMAGSQRVIVIKLELL